MIGMDPKNFKKLAQKLKLPGGGRFDGRVYSWHKERGHAGGKVVSRVAEAAVDLGWTQQGHNDHSSPDGSTMGSSSPYTSPEGYKLTVGSSYGVTAYENSFYIRLVLAPEPVVAATSTREKNPMPGMGATAASWDEWRKQQRANVEAEKSKVGENRVIKLDKNQLRSLIKESMQHIPFGEASKHFDEMMTPEVNEAPKKVGASSFGPPNANTNNIVAMDAFIAEIEDGWRDMYDEADPTMAHLGKKAWEQQVSTACDHLVDEIQVALDKVEGRLVDGEFYDGKSENDTSEEDYLEFTGKRSDREDFHSDG